MTQSAVSTQLAQKFDNTAPSAAVTPCCKNVKGTWEKIPAIYPTTNSKFLGPGKTTMSYYFDAIPKAVTIWGKFRQEFRIRGKLVCKCMDDGRTLSSTEVNETVSFDIQIPMAYMPLLRRANPWGWWGLAYDAIKLAKKAYDIYNMSPEIANEILKNLPAAAKKTIEKMKSSADDLCKSKHKCPEEPKKKEEEKPPPENKPGVGEPGPGEALIS
ncbi:MAG: hypothetical protein R3F14_02225 [Polyangiaceae bacterium]